MDYVYDLASKIKQVTDPTGSYGFAYDNMGRLIGTTTQYAFLPGNTYTNAYSYDAASNRTGFTAPDGSTNTYAYDTLGRLSTLTNSLAGQFGFSYDNLSRRTSLNRPNGVNTSYSYDSVSRLLNVLHKAGTAMLDGAGYTYDNAGNRTAKTNYLNNITEQYTYDPIYQLTQVTQGTTTTESYSYDAVGNRLSSLGMSPYAYNSSNELTSTSAATFTYDSNGNMLTKADSNGTRTYNWDFENRLSLVVLPGSNGTVAFAYDPFGRRIQKSSSSGTTNYLYDGANSVAEVGQTGTFLSHYAQGSGVDDLLAELRMSTVGFYQQDGLGSVTSVADSGGTLLNSDIYDSFGNVSSSTGAFINPYLYTGREADLETGLRYYRARYFDPAIGRFITEDPSVFDLEWPNLYSYVKNRATGLNDPLGLSPQALGPFVCTWCGELGAGAAWMWDGYGRMQARGWIGADKYYHCMANCRATNVGPGGAAAAKIISFFRTDVRSRWTEPTDWRNDKVANTCGQKGGDCEKTCAPFVPKSSPGKRPFPGW